MQLDPITNLPKVRTKIDPITGREIPASGRTPYTSGIGYSSSGPTGTYETYQSRGIRVDPRSDIEELRAIRQHWLDKWGNGLGKAGVIFAGTVVDNTAGFLYGLGEYAAGGFGGFDEFKESLVQNPISQFTRSVKDATAEALPNYYTRAEQQTTDLISANFWADKFLGGVAYTAGAIGTAWLTGGAGLLSSSARLGVNAVTAGLKGTKAAAAYAAGKTIASNVAKRAGTVLPEAVSTGMLEGARRLPRGLSMLESGTAMSMAEASIEASEVREMKIRDGKERYMQENGLTDESQIPPNVLQTIEIQAAQAEGAAFYANLAVLIPTNLIAFGKMLKPMNPHKLNLNSRVIPGIDDAGRFVAKDAYAEMGRFGRAAARTRDFAAPYVKGSVTEAFQEGAQSAIQRGLEEFESDRYYDSGSADLFEVLMKGGSMQTLKESLGDIGDAAVSSFQDKDARESMLIGAIIGLITQGTAGFTALKESDARTKESLELLNNPNFYDLKDRAGTTNAAIKYANLMEQARERGDMKSYYDYQMLLFQEKALYHVKNGTFDVFIKKLEDTKNMTQEELEETGIASGAMLPTSELNPADELIKRTKNFVKIVEKVNTMFPGTQMPMGAQALFMSKARKEELARQIRDENIYKSALIRTSAMREGLDSRISQVSEELKKLAPDINIDKIVEPKTKEFAKVVVEGTNETLEAPDKDAGIFEEIDRALNTIKDPIDQILFKQKTGYLNSLLSDRDYVLSAQDNLLRSPEERDLYVQRAKLREEAELKKARDEVVSKSISDTVTSEELQNRFSTFENISDEAHRKYTDEIVKRTADESAVIIKFNAMRKSEVEALNKDNATPLELKLKEKYLSERTKEEPLTAQPQPTQQRQKQQPDTTGEASESETNSPEQFGEGQTLEDLLNNPEVKPKDTSTQKQKPTRDNSNEIVTRTTLGLPPGVTAKGQFILVEDGKVLVNNNGDPVHSDFNDKRTLGGNPILDPSYLSSKDVFVGKEVTLEVIEDDWWNENKNTYRDSVLENIPIYVKVDDKYVGVLNSGAGSLRAAAYRAFLNGNNGSVTTKIDDKYANNIFNAVDSTGEPFMYNPVESIGEFYLAYLDENSKWILGTPEGVRKETLDTITAQINSSASIGINKKLTPGQVGFVVKDPNNNWKVLIGSTARLSEEDINIAVDHLKKNNSVLFTQLVGTNILPGPAGIRLYYGDKTEGNILIDLVDENGNRLLGDKLENNIISIDMGTVKKILTGKFKGVDTIPKTLRNNMVVEYGVVEVTAKGTEVYGIIQKENNLSPEDIDFIYNNLEKLIINLLAQKRYNVPEAFINNSSIFRDQKSLLEYLTDPRSEDGSYNGRLRTNIKAVNGTPFFDIGLRLSSKFTEGAKAPTRKERVEPQSQPESQPELQPEIRPESDAERRVITESEGPKNVKKRRASAKKAEQEANKTIIETNVVSKLTGTEVSRENLSPKEINFMEGLDRIYADREENGVLFEDFIKDPILEKFPPHILDLWIAEQQKKNC